MPPVQLNHLHSTAGRASLGFALVVVLLSASPIAGQHMSVGGRVGMLASHALFEDEINNGRTDPRLGFQVGAIAERELTDFASVRAELLYSEKGWEEYNTGGGRRFGYIDVPILVSLRLPFFQIPYLSFGAYGAFEINCSVTGVATVGSVSCNDPAAATSRQSFDYGIAGGLGLGYPLFGGKVLADFTLSYGLQDLNKEPVPPGYQRLATVALSARYMFPVGG